MKQSKTTIISKYGTKYGTGEKDTGSVAVQVALLTHKIKDLSEHLTEHKHDHHSQRGLMMMIGQRKRLLKFLEFKNREQYKNLIQDLGLRK